MEIVIQRGKGLVIGFRLRLALQGKAGVQLKSAGVIAIGGGHAQDGRFDRSAHEAGFLDCGRRELPHFSRLFGANADQVHIFQTIECIAHGLARHAEMIGDLGFGNACARQQSHRRDLAIEIVHDLVYAAPPIARLYHLIHCTSSCDASIY